MSAAPQTFRECPRCGLEPPTAARFCPGCGAALDPELAPVHEHAPGPVNVQRAHAHWLGIPAPLVLLCVGFAALGGAIGLFASGHWPFGLVLLGVAALVLAAYGELSFRESAVGRRSSLLVSDGRERATTWSEVWRARFEELLHRHRARTQLDEIELVRRPALQELGRAVYEGDEAAALAATARLQDLDERKARVERELEEKLAERDERIRQARFPVQDTVMVAPNEPSAPYPPPDEGTPPTPAPVPEPYPPPDEGTPPTPEE